MEYIYNIIAGTEILVCLLLISHYVYLEPTLSSRKGWYWLSGCFFICMAVIQVPHMVPEDIEIIIPFVFFGIYILSARRSRKIRGMFLVIPVSGLLFSFVSLAFTVPYILNSSVILLDRRYYMVLDALLWAGLLVFWLRGKCRHWRAKFEQELALRMLTQMCIRDRIWSVWANLRFTCIIISLLLTACIRLLLYIYLSIPGRFLPWTYHRLSCKILSFSSHCPY